MSAYADKLSSSSTTSPWRAIACGPSPRPWVPLLWSSPPITRTRSTVFATTLPTSSSAITCWEKAVPASNCWRNRRFNLLSDDTIFMMVTGEQAYEQVVAAVELVPDDYIIAFLAGQASPRPTASWPRNSSPPITARSAARITPPPWRYSPAAETAKPAVLTGLKSLRQEAETHLAAGDVSAAEAAYRNILADYEFPGLGQESPVPSTVSRNTPRRGQKSNWSSPEHLLISMPPISRRAFAWWGEHAEAQKVPDEIARKTPQLSPQSGFWRRPPH